MNVGINENNNWKKSKMQFQYTLSLMMTGMLSELEIA